MALGALCALGCSSETPAGGEAGATSSGGQANTAAGSSSAVPGSAGSGGSSSSGGPSSSGCLAAAGGSGAGAGDAGGSGGAATAGAASGGVANGVGCDSPGLVWKSARKTWYTSYPDPNSEECVAYNGCTWAGQFAACDDKKPEAWVQQHDIVAAFPDFGTLKLHDLCLKSGDKSIVVTVLDTCADSDCDGCCTQNQGDNEQLIDLESYTNERWGVDDGVIQWADLGPTSGDGCN